MNIEHRLRAFIAANFLYQSDSESLREDESLIGSGVVDSTGILELVEFLEKTFGIKVADSELTTENLDNIANLKAYLGRKLHLEAQPESSTASHAEGAPGAGKEGGVGTEKSDGVQDNSQDKSQDKRNAAEKDKAAKQAPAEELLPGEEARV